MKMLDRQSCLSVIMPVYNGEKYIADAVHSVLNQPEKDLLLIVINDGSEDSTEQILHMIEKEDDRLFVYSQINSGVSVARNKGIEISIEKGARYIAFLDADDVWCKGFFNEKILTLLSQDKYDFLGFDYYTAAEDLARGNRFCALEKKDFYSGPFCSKIYSVDIIESKRIRFPKNCKHQEDVVFRFVYSYYSRIYKCVHESIFLYRSNEQSVVHQHRDAYETYFMSVLPAWEWAMAMLKFDNRMVAQCETMIRTYLIEYILVSGEQGIIPRKAIETVENSKYRDYLFNNNIWISEKHKKLLFEFQSHPKKSYIKSRLNSVKNRAQHILRRFKIAQKFFYKDRIDYLSY